jgi:hypothetical protein
MRDRGNQIEEDRLTAEIGLLRAVFGRRWKWIGPRVGMSPIGAWRAAKDGRRALDEAIERGRLTREALLGLIEDCIPAND